MYRRGFCICGFPLQNGSKGNPSLSNTGTITFIFHSDAQQCESLCCCFITDDNAEDDWQFGERSKCIPGLPLPNDKQSERERGGRGGGGGGGERGMAKRERERK